MSLYVESGGVGRDLVLLHGWAMHSGIWRDVRERLAQHFRLHLVDLPGHGFSSPHGTGPGQGMLEHTIQSIAKILPEDCILCGWSLGGQIAIELAKREQARVKKLALISTTPCFAKRDDWQWGMEAGTLQLFAVNLKRDYKGTLNRFLTLQISGGDDTTAVLARLRKSLFERGKPDEVALEVGLRHLLLSDMRGAIKSIAQPVLLIHGEKDVITHPGAAKWMNEHLPRSELIILNGCGHAPFLSYPDQFVEHMLRLKGSVTR
ncbi:pimeloyl-ACP methyl ester esterase BioH [Nitrosospira sp. Is2]|uniref:pimeloyl-ACP methyl ester esterase BioH n=1 Tax=Nitrosospira sp. Is2 TaxID=3080532 RepID=UPI0029537755|nr:pimeloyl-ACP methyl ester esterase BioH [Nitrosospira sp. Is2]WON73320.1 pimeloyl-ACP methyl ester esterase BioH [Nitrosospira sp. Is2]